YTISFYQGCFGYPLSIFFIVVNEFCERFSYYGMRALLILYFRRFIGWDDNLSTAIYHTFVALCYLTPILGALIADSWLGKFKVFPLLQTMITSLSPLEIVAGILSIINHQVLGSPSSSCLHFLALSMIGLALIALGTGGIKPCVSAFGGDQFEEGQEKQRNRFFSIFYLAINAGSLLSTIITPILRGKKCDIFAFQALLPVFFSSPVVFVIGSGMYKKFQPQGNVMAKVVKCIGFLIKLTKRKRTQMELKQLDGWSKKAKQSDSRRSNRQSLADVDQLFTYLRVSVYLFHTATGKLKSQMTTANGSFPPPRPPQTVNAILIVIMVPIMDAVVYPLIAKCGLNFTSLKKMTVGMFLASMAFVVAAIVQVEIDRTLPVFPKPTEVQVKVLNIGNSKMTASFPGMQVTLPQMSQTNDFMTFAGDKLTSINISSPGSPVNVVTYNFEQGHRHTLLVWDPNNFQVVKDGLNQKPEKGENGIRFINSFDESFNITMDDKVYVNVTSHNASEYQFFPSGVKHFTINSTQQIPQKCERNFQSSNLFFNSLLTSNISCPELHIFEDISPNTVNMALQIPQYFLLTCGEVVFSVTGLEFSYSQAPSNMKSVLQAGWLLTVAVGNIIVLIVAGAGQFSEQWAEYVLFAALLLVVCVIFAIMARFYTYVNPAEIEAQFDNEDEKKNAEKMNIYCTTPPVSQTQM
uniref:Solute carrier family 15 member 1 n=1 Tax=Mustela putorius furo TaxID=9669 RepID=M3YJ40_MUSPF